MGFSNGSYAKLWKIEKVKGKDYYLGQISTSRKNQKGEYENDFSASFVRIVGEAAKAADAGKIKAGDRIYIARCDVTNKYDKEKKTEFVNYTIFACEKADGKPQIQQRSQQRPDPSSFNNVQDDMDEELPFS